MADTTIEWADKVWNPVTGCTKISLGCKNCYAKRLHDLRHQAYQEGKKLPAQYAGPFETVQLHPDRLEDPLHWKKPARIFVNSMSDLFHQDVPFKFIDQVFVAMKLAWWHTFMILTKRPQRMHEYMTKYTNGGWDRWEIIRHDAIEKRGSNSTTASTVWPIRNVWLGVSVEDQMTADERIPVLLRTPAAVRFVSCEPILEYVDLIKIFKPDGEDYDDVDLIDDGHEPEEFIEECEAECDWINFGNDLVVNPEYTEWKNWRKRRAQAFAMGRQLSMVIAGSESGPDHRIPEEQDNIMRSLRDQCQISGVKYFLKQMWVDGYLIKMPVLDGKIWNEFPEVM